MCTGGITFPNIQATPAADSLLNMNDIEYCKRSRVPPIIGAGGFGIVEVVTVRTREDWYALKVVKKARLSAQKSGRSMIFSELEALAKAGSHPFLVSLHMAYHDRHHCYLVLDLKVGGDLDYFLRSNIFCHFEEQDVAFYVACISSALEHLHSKGVIHRDVKPGNIILDEHGWPFLTDFGISHVHSAENSAKFGGTFTCTLSSGTKPYLAPEVYCREHIHGPEVDFWALGIVAYEMLFSKRPFALECPLSYVKYLQNALATKRTQARKGTLHGAYRNNTVKYLKYFSPAEWFCAPCVSHSSMDDTSSRTSSLSTERIPYGDHWAVDGAARLSADLCVEIPQHSERAVVSPACVDFLQRMLDVRPSFRLSSRDIDAVRTHPWMVQNGLSEWENTLHNRGFNQHIIPGKVFLRSSFPDVLQLMKSGARNNILSPIRANDNLYTNSCDIDDVNDILTLEQRESYRGFRYTSEEFKNLYWNEEPEVSPVAQSARVNPMF